MKPWPLLVLLPLVACAESTSPDVRCDGLLEVTTVTTRFGGDTVVACTFPPPDTVYVPPDTIFVPEDDDCDDDHGHGHGRHHRYGHHDHPRGHR